MSNKLALSLIALTASLAGAAPSAPKPIAARVLFSLDTKLKAQVAGMPISDFTLFTNGRWSYVVMADGKVTKRADGTLPRADVAKIQKALAPAQWTFTTQQLRCMAEAISYSEVSFAGKLVWTNETCSGKILDETSRKGLDQVMVIVNPLIASVH
jgi:hypothetical protein